MKIVILHNQISDNASADEADVLDQVNLVHENLLTLNHTVEIFPVSLNLYELKNYLEIVKPDAVFNLVESLNNQGELIALVPALLEVLKVPFTGSSYEATFLTSNKTVAKKLMQFHRINTPSVITEHNFHQASSKKRYIIKPIWEDGSLYLDEENVVDGEELKKRALSIDWKNFFVEEYIDGREFNISILSTSNGPLVLNPAEIVFQNYHSEKPKIVGYKAKWHEDSFEYQNTVRQFPTIDPELKSRLNKVCVDCWNAFQLKGYARVDIRLDHNQTPYVLEVNPNPCISPDSGFIAALADSGIPILEAINNIINDLNR
ncbi:MAG TPA: ATP-grasp domain-containing protein [Salinivirgaceae bacterium]|nr:ATP-grasp domain-containing protein [Salinivirgaceae bacterium]